MKRVLLVAVLLGAAFACDDIDEALRLRREMDGGAGGGAVGGGGGGGGGEGGGGMSGGGAGGGMIGGGGGEVGGGGGGGGEVGGGGGGGPMGGGMGGGIGPLVRQVCVSDFCWEHPRPQGNTLQAVFGMNANDVWVVGDVGTVLRWRNGFFESYGEHFPREQVLNSVWGAGDKLWVVGSAADPAPSMKPRRFEYGDGGWVEESWDGSQPSNLISIRGSDLNEVWASGVDGVIARRNPVTNTWHPSTIHGGGLSLRAVAVDATGVCKVAIEGDLNGVGPCDGGALELTLPTEERIYNNMLWSPAPGVFYAGGANISMTTYEGRIFARENDTWDAGFRGDRFCTAGFGQGSFGFAFCGNGAIREVPGYASITTNADEAYLGGWTPGSLEGSWLVGRSGVLNRHDGTQWVPLSGGSRADVFSLFVSAQHAVAGGVQSTVFTRGADGTWADSVAGSGVGDVHGLFFDSNGFRVFVGSARMILEGTTTLAQAPGVPVPGDNGGRLNALWGTGKDDLWAVGVKGELWHRSASGWSGGSIFTDGGEWDLDAIDGLDQNTVYITGSPCLAFSKAGADGGWVQEAMPCSTYVLRGLWAAPPNDAGLDAVAVGPTGEAFFRVDGGWTSSPIVPPARGALSSVWGSSPKDIYAVGQTGAMVHFDGLSWTALETGTRNDLNSVRGRALADGGVELFIAGAEGTILRRER